MKRRSSGDMLNELTSALPKEDFRGYMFNPKRSLTMQGLINQILEADGITQEMLDAQKTRVDLIQDLIEAEDEQRQALIREHDEQIDEEFFATFSAMGSQLAQSGQSQWTTIFEQLQIDLLEHSSFGKDVSERQQAQQATLEAVSGDIEKLGESATKQDFVKLLWDYRDDDEKVQAMVGLIRPLFDYEFFQLLAGQIGKAPSDDRAKLEALRDRVYELTQSIDEQSREMMQQLAQVLQAIVNSPDPLKR